MLLILRGHRWLLVVLFGVLLSALGCREEDGQSSSLPPGAEQPAMGFAFFPGVIWSTDPARYIQNYSARADLMSLHWDIGIPWETLSRCPRLDSCDLSADPALEAVRQQIVAVIHDLSLHAANSLQVYLAISPLNENRDGVAPNYEAERTLGYTPPGADFSNAVIRELYKEFCLYLLAKIQPDHFSPGIEMNMYLLADSADFHDLILLMTELKTEAEYQAPSVIVSPSLQWEFWKQQYADPLYRSLLDDLIDQWSSLGSEYALSTYPHLLTAPDTTNTLAYAFANYGLIPSEAMPLFISECGAPPVTQSWLIHTVFALPATYSLRGVVWFFLEDLDALNFPVPFPNLGLYDDFQPNSLVPHPGLAVWDSIFASP